MEKTGIRKMTRSFVFWFIGSAVLLIAGIVVIQNFQETNPRQGKDIATTEKSEAQLSDRKAKRKQALSRVQPPSSVESSSVTASEERISQIIGSGRPVEDMAKELLILLPESKGAEQALVASHLANLADGEQLDKLVSYLSDPRLNKKSKEEIFTAIYQTEPKQAAELLIKVIDDDVQEFAEEAENGLSILLQADHGTDVAAWRSELDKSGKFLEPDIIGE